MQTMNKPKCQCVRWPQHSRHMQTKFADLWSQEKWCDVTVACDDGQTIRAHRIILCAGSQYLERVLSPVSANTEAYVILHDCSYEDVRLIVQFMYSGMINVAESQLPSLQKTAKSLEVIGLAMAFDDSCMHQNTLDGLVTVNGNYGRECVQQQPPSLARLTIEQSPINVGLADAAKQPHVLITGPTSATLAPNTWPVERVGWWRTQPKTESLLNSASQCDHDYYEDDDGAEESCFMAYQYGYVNETQYETNLSALSGNNYPFINAAVIENINKTVTNDEQHDRIHVSQLMCALWDKEELAQRQLGIPSNGMNDEDLQQLRSPLPRPLTPEKLWFIRDECFRRLEAIEKETGIDVTNRKRKFTKYAHDVVDDQKKLKMNSDRSVNIDGADDGNAR